jgi:asparaginyl-tRNA synthetase
VAKTVEAADVIEIPKPLQELSGPELLRKQQVGRVSTETLRYLTSALTKKGFDWLLPVVFSKSTDPLWPDPGASIEKRVETEMYGETVRATQSMIIHKLVACSTTYPKFFVLSPNIRVERRERKATGRHVYEFTQIDFEIRSAGFKDVRSLVEGLIAGLIGHLRRKAKGELLSLGRYGDLEAPTRPFEVHDRRALLAKYGEEWETRLPRAIREPVWVTNIPREFYDFEDPASGRWDNYDLLVPGYGEILSGARREWQYGKISRKMERDGVRKENYALLLKLAKEGRLRPSAGAGIGVERLVGWIVGAEHVGEVQPFPKVPGVVYEL